jgi:hypothetical protein
MRVTSLGSSNLTQDHLPCAPPPSRPAFPRAHVCSQVAERCWAARRTARAAEPSAGCRGSSRMRAAARRDDPRETPSAHARALQGIASAPACTCAVERVEATRADGAALLSGQPRRICRYNWKPGVPDVKNSAAPRTRGAAPRTRRRVHRVLGRWSCRSAAPQHPNVRTS